MEKSQQFNKTGGKGISLLEHNRVCEKDSETNGGEHARGKQKYSSGQHHIRLQLEQLANQQASNGMRIGIISSTEGPIDLFSHSVPDMCIWIMSSEDLEQQGQEEEEEDEDEEGNTSVRKKSKWSGANLGDILELTIDCDQENVSIRNERTGMENTKKVNLDDIPFPWELIVSFTMGPDRIRLL